MKRRKPAIDGTIPPWLVYSFSFLNLTSIFGKLQKNNNYRIYWKRNENPKKKQETEFFTAVLLELTSSFMKWNWNLEFWNSAQGIRNPAND